jgi:hypothetical protein
LKPEQRVRVEAANADVVEGRFLKVSDETVVLGLKEKDLLTTRSVPITFIQSLQVEKDEKMAGAFIGAVSGATVFALWAVNTHPLTPGSAALIGGVFGAIVGAATGVIVGSAVNYWEPVYPKP